MSYTKHILKKFLPIKSGVTLIEFLIYFGILSILIMVTGSVFFNIMYGKTKLETIHEVNQNARIITEQIVESVRNAQSITAPVAGATGNSLTLVMSDLSQNPTVFDLSGGAVRIKKGSGPAISLNATETIVTNLSFVNVTYPSTPGAIRMTLTITDSNSTTKKEYNHSATFYTTATIRPK